MYIFFPLTGRARRILRVGLAGFSALLTGCTSTGPGKPAPQRPVYMQEFSRSFILYADTADTAGMALLKNPAADIQQAVRVVVHRKAGRETGVELKAATNRHITPGDELIFMGSVRAVPPLDQSKSVEGSFAVHPDNPQQALARQSFIAREDWTPVQFSFTADQAYKKGGLVVSMYAGGKAQSLEIGDPRLINRGPQVKAAPPEVTTPAEEKQKPAPSGEKPKKPTAEPEATRPPAPKQPPLAPVTSGPTEDWRKEAASRIEKIRKADFLIQVQDTRGKPIKGAELSITQSRHDFTFGVAVNKRYLAKQESPDQRNYGEVVASLFNEAVFENGMKWNQWDSSAAPFLKADTLAAFRWLQERNIPVRGHVLVWPGWNKQNPSDLDNLSPDELRQRIQNHIVDLVGHFRGSVHRWDVVNELRTNKDFTTVLGEQAVADWFRTAHQANPDAKLYFNEFGILNGPERNLVELENTVASLLKEKAPIHGIGLQGHFNRFLPAPEQMLARLDRLAKLGLDLHISEFDVDSDDEARQAAFTKDVYTLAFSHPAVSGVTSWGLWEGQHWRPQAALYRKNWEIKPNGKVVKDLLTNQWHTKLKEKTDKKGEVAGRGFLGRYDVVVKKDGRESRHTFELKPNGRPWAIKEGGTGDTPAVKPPPAKPDKKPPAKPVVIKPVSVKKAPPKKQPAPIKPVTQPPPAKLPVRAPVKPEAKPETLPSKPPAQKPAVIPEPTPSPPIRKYQIRKVAPPPEPGSAQTGSPVTAEPLPEPEPKQK